MTFRILRLIAIFCGLSLSTQSFAQQTGETMEGKIEYEEIANLHRQLPPESAEMKAMIPEFKTSQHELLFNASESLYRRRETEEEAYGNQALQIRMSRSEAYHYQNWVTQRRVSKREFMGKYYLIEDSIVQTPWKIMGELRDIAGYTCMRAIWNDTARQRVVTAWFTPDLPVFSGPINFGQLPGAILEIDINDGETVITAKKITFAPLPKNELAAPVKGEKTTTEGYNRMIEKRAKDWGRPGNINKFKN